MSAWPDKPAFPTPSPAATPGLTKREYIATQILSAIVAGSTGTINGDLACKQAVTTADQLLLHLRKAEV